MILVFVVLVNQPTFVSLHLSHPQPWLDIVKQEWMYAGAIQVDTL